MCANTSATAVGDPSNPDGLTRPKKKRSVIETVVHNVKKKMKPKWNDSKPEPDKIRKNYNEIDEYIEKRKKPKVHHRPKAYNLSDGTQNDGFAPEAGVYGHGGDGGDGPF
ncbi:unnamed protein product [Calypogeia fissa]